MRRVFCLALAGLWLSLSTLAVQPLPLSVAEMARRSDLVVRGLVRAKTCQRDPAGRIYTRVELEVREVWKGVVPRSPFVVVQAGGVLGRERVTGSSAAKLGLGEDLVLFLRLNERGEGVVLSLGHGEFPVSQAGGENERTVRSAVGLETKLDSDADTAGRGGRVPLSEFRALVRTALEPR